MVVFFSGLWAEKKHLQHTERLVLLLELAACLSSAPQCLEEVFLWLTHGAGVGGNVWSSLVSTAGEHNIGDILEV